MLNFPTSAALGGFPGHRADLPAGTLQSWQRVHDLLGAEADRPYSAPSFAELTAYYYCVSQACQPQVDATAFLQQRLLRLAAELNQQTRPRAWSAARLHQACAAAGLAARLAASPAPALSGHLLRLDAALPGQAQRLARQQDPANRRCFFRILRYFNLRLASGLDAALLAELLALLPQLPPTAALGLADGLAAELLVLLHLHRAGIRHPALVPSLEQGLTRLLSLRHPVDFLENQYAAFPYQATPPPDPVALFSSELSWRHGDIGQSLLLYRVHHQRPDGELLQVAELVGLNTLLRTSGLATQLTSSQVEQGTAGTAYLYHKLHQLSGQSAYRAGFTFWLEQTSKLLRQELANGFYQKQQGNIMHGLVGVGLVLLSALAEQNLNWDELVL